jgi:hypothetical protein
VGSFWWKEVISLSDEYMAITRCEVKSGSSVPDNWKDQTWDFRFPRLFSFAKDKLQSVKDFIMNDSIVSNFHLPLSVEAHDELMQLQDLIQDTTLQSQQHDEWICTLGTNTAGFKPSMIYHKHFQAVGKHHPSAWVWKSKCTSKHKFFACLILHVKINTKDMLVRRNWNVTSNHACVLCPGNKFEEWRHLFFNCMLSTRIWNYL